MKQGGSQCNVLGPSCLEEARAGAAEQGWLYHWATLCGRGQMEPLVWAHSPTHCQAKMGQPLPHLLSGPAQQLSGCERVEQSWLLVHPPTSSALAQGRGGEVGRWCAVGPGEVGQVAHTHPSCCLSLCSPTMDRRSHMGGRGNKLFPGACSVWLLAALTL